MSEPTRPISVPTAPITGRRSTWADIAKGSCIVLVVLWHVVAKHYLQIQWQPKTPLPGAWGTFGESLLPLRMPVFFTVSGMFAVSAVNAPSFRLAGTKAARLGYLYIVWLLIHTVLLSLTPAFATERADNLPQLLAELTISPTNLWYLQALALYFVVARAARSGQRYLPVPVLLAAALVLSVVASTTLIPGVEQALAGNRVDVLQNLLFFLCGLHLRPTIERFAGGADRRQLVISGTVFATVMLLVAIAGALAWPGVWPLCGVLATAFAVTAAAQLARWQRIGEPIARLGRQTLPIYVLHLPVLAVLDLLLARPAAAASGPAGLLLAAIEPVAVTALVVAACLVLHRGLIAVGAGRLFDLASGRVTDSTSRRPTDPAGGSGTAPSPGSGQVSHLAHR